MNDRKEGYGEFFWYSGNVYKGNYHNDEREGYGEMHFTDKTIYKGNWQRGIQTGNAAIILPDGTFKEGYFKNNIFYGESSPKSSEKSFGYGASPNRERRNLKSSVSSLSNLLASRDSGIKI